MNLEEEAKKINRILAANRDEISLASKWKQREKQIEKVMENSIGMHACIRGIAGNAIQSIPGLELGNGIASLDENQ